MGAGMIGFFHWCISLLYCIVLYFIVLYCIICHLLYFFIVFLYCISLNLVRCVFASGRPHISSRGSVSVGRSVACFLDASLQMKVLPLVRRRVGLSDGRSVRPSVICLFNAPFSSPVHL